MSRVDDWRERTWLESRARPPCTGYVLERFRAAPGGANGARLHSPDLVHPQTRAGAQLSSPKCQRVRRLHGVDRPAPSLNPGQQHHRNVEAPLVSQTDAEGHSATRADSMWGHLGCEWRAADAACVAVWDFEGKGRGGWNALPQNSTRLRCPTKWTARRGMREQLAERRRSSSPLASLRVRLDFESSAPLVRIRTFSLEPSKKQFVAFVLFDVAAACQKDACSRSDPSHTSRILASFLPTATSPPHTSVTPEDHQPTWTPFLPAQHHPSSRRNDALSEDSQYATALDLLAQRRTYLLGTFSELRLGAHAPRGSDDDLEARLARPAAQVHRARLPLVPAADGPVRADWQLGGERRAVEVRGGPAQGLPLWECRGRLRGMGCVLFRLLGLRLCDHEDFGSPCDTAQTTRRTRTS